MKQKDISVSDIFQLQFNRSKIQNDSNMDCVVICSVETGYGGFVSMKMDMRKYSLNVITGPAFDKDFTFLRFSGGIPVLISTKLYNDLSDELKLTI